jgi:AcrR family transcriptional regulator
MEYTQDGRDAFLELGVTQPVIYSAFDGRQALIDAVALQGFADLATALGAAALTPLARMSAYLAFVGAHPRTYAAMFSLPSGLRFAAKDNPQPMQDAFAGIADAFPGEDETRAEVAWSVMHGLATLSAGGRLRPDHAQARLDLVDHMLAQETLGCAPWLN